MIKKVGNLDELQHEISKNDFVLIYFSHTQCNVCKVLKPKIAELIEATFPKVSMIYTDTIENPEIAGQYSVFTVPTIILFVAQREAFRRSRNAGIDEIHELISRPYSMYYDE